jgi:hypothetical protein
MATGVVPERAWVAQVEAQGAGTVVGQVACTA